MIKEFNWDTANGSKERIEWLKKNHNKTISEDEFIIEMKKLRIFSNTPTLHGKRQGNYTPHKLKRKYSYLKNTFGFFV